jgi:hypothetical protein
MEEFRNRILNKANADRQITLLTNGFFTLAKLLMFGVGCR